MPSLALALLASAFDPSNGPVDLGTTIVFRNPAECEAGEPLQTIFSQMFSTDQQLFEASRGNPITVDGFSTPLQPSFERTSRDGISRVTATLDVPGRWHGLRVTGLTVSFAENADETFRVVRFAASPARVRAVLNRAGFALPPAGERRQLDIEGELPSHIGVERAPGGANLVCTSG